MKQNCVATSTWLSIHLNPTAAEHSFLDALVKKSRLYTLSNVSMIVETLLLLSFAPTISPFELTFIWLFNNVSNHPLPDLCIDKIAKNRTGLHAHSSLQKHHQTHNLNAILNLTHTNNPNTDLNFWKWFCKTLFRYWFSKTKSLIIYPSYPFTSGNDFRENKFWKSSINKFHAFYCFAKR